MSSSLDTANANLQVAQAVLAADQATLSKLQSDPQAATFKNTITAIQNHLGQLNPNDKNGYHYWMDGSGNIWSGSDANASWDNAWDYINSINASITAIQNKINTDNANITTITTQIQQLEAADPTLKAQANVINAAAQDKLYAGQDVKYIIIGIVVLAIIAVTIHLIRQRKKRGAAAA